MEKVGYEGLRLETCADKPTCLQAGPAASRFLSQVDLDQLLQFGSILPSESPCLVDDTSEAEVAVNLLCLNGINN